MSSSTYAPRRGLLSGEQDPDSDGQRETHSPGDRDLVSVVGALLLLSVAPSFKQNLVSLSVCAFVLLLPVSVKSVRQSRELRVTVLLLAVWAGGQGFTDLLQYGVGYRVVSSMWEPLFICVALVTLYAAFITPRAASWLIAIILLGDAVFYALTPDQGVTDNPWKFAFGIPAVLAGSLAAGRYWPTGRMLVGCLIWGLAGINFVLGFRSLGAVCVVAGVLILTKRKRPRSKWSVVRAVCLIGIAAFVALSVYSHAANAGWLGTSQQQKYQSQSSSSVGLLLAGRPELLMSSVLIERHPYLGLGSQVEVSNADIDAVLQRASALGTGFSSDEQTRLFGSGANAHSLLFGSWLSAGAASVPFWLYALYIVVSALGADSRRWSKLFPLLAVWGMLLAWDVMFSPWSPHYELMLGTVLALAMKVRGADRSSAHVEDVPGVPRAGALAKP